jgi:hypothetical protein
MRRYYDAHLYLANWGTHRIMLRLPRTLLDPEIAGRYCVDGRVSISTTHDYVILDLTSEDEAGEWVEDAEESLSTTNAGISRRYPRPGRRSVVWPRPWLAGLPAG